MYLEILEMHARPKAPYSEIILPFSTHAGSPENYLLALPKSCLFLPLRISARQPCITFYFAAETAFPSSVYCFDSVAKVAISEHALKL